MYIYIYIYMDKTNVVLIIICNVSCYEKKNGEIEFLAFFFFFFMSYQNILQFLTFKAFLV